VPDRNVDEWVAKTLVGQIEGYLADVRARLDQS
jgi:hypothetical protein